MTPQSSSFLFFFAQIFSLLIGSEATTENLDLTAPPPPPSSFWRFSPVSDRQGVCSHLVKEELFSFLRARCPIVQFSTRNLLPSLQGGRRASVPQSLLSFLPSVAKSLRAHGTQMNFQIDCSSGMINMDWMFTVLSRMVRFDYFS